ncbi:response regulator transcription factor [Cupriavidus plantarum]|uniref:response regulator transcription factor n=1 Tax=Cupriavidus plantarum TaxID=942865 RepID=UPI001B01122E|nr:response regulator transcription factor [Cupriavidus plantarum]CAG2150607.1 Sensory transduction protein regX3 [Cupriavidus plantarum]SMR67887.1 two component transcriptional regulator, winged helix family [Cupriavidus plantarum]
MGITIASLEDDLSDAALIRETAAAAGHACTTFTRGCQMLRALRATGYDMLLIEWSVAGVSGRDVLAWARAHLDPRLPVMFVTVRDAEDDIVDVLMAGADDYMVKPIRPAELMARIHALVRRAYPESLPVGSIVARGAFVFDGAARMVTREGVEILLTPKEFDLAMLLFRYEGRVVSREHMVAAVWGHDLAPMSRTIDTHISRVRTKLGLVASRGARLAPVFTHGYRLELFDVAEPGPATKKAPEGAFSVNTPIE